MNLKRASVMLFEKSIVLDNHRPKVSRILAEETIPFHMKDYAGSKSADRERCTGKNVTKYLVRLSTGTGKDV